MITLTRCNGTTIMVNEGFIEIAEETPDTVVTMFNGHSYIVQESLSEIADKIDAFRKGEKIETANSGVNPFDVD
ncbi:MAG: flagellar FlbD family protein [Oscillospiraceae bacterium]|nr:flagellar FlbD family protein [Oscillospiraceae bacterium]